jgi:cell division protein FtsA
MAFKLVDKIRPNANKEQYLVALDIGTEFVKALIGRVHDNQVEIIGVGRQRQRLTDMQSGAVTDIAGVVDNCDAALKAAEEMAGVVAKDTVMGIAGELVKGTATTIKYKRTDSQTRIEMPELRKILERVQGRAFERARETLAWETGQQEIDVKMVNTAIVDVQIDGYRVTNPIGFQGRDVSIQLFNAFAPMVHIGALQQVGNNLDLNVINIAAEPYGGVEGTKMFGIGGRSFTKRIAQVAGVSFDEAEEMKLDYSAGKLAHIKDKAAVEEAVNADIKVWLSGVELSLGEFTKIDHLPSKILLCGGGTGLPQIKKALSSDWYKRLPFARKPIVSHIEPSQVARVTDATGQLTSFADITPMGLANLGLDVINTGSLSENMLQKLSKTLQT